MIFISVNVVTDTSQSIINSLPLLYFQTSNTLSMKSYKFHKDKISKFCTTLTLSLSKREKKGFFGDI